MFLLRAVTSALLVAVLLVCPYGCLGKELAEGGSLLSRTLGCCGHCGTSGDSGLGPEGSCVPDADCLCHGAVLQHRAAEVPLALGTHASGQTLGYVPQLFATGELPCRGIERAWETTSLLPSGRTLCAQLGVFLC